MSQDKIRLVTRTLRKTIQISMTCPQCGNTGELRTEECTAAFIIYQDQIYENINIRCSNCGNETEIKREWAD